MPRFNTDKQAKEVLENKVIELSLQVEALKAQIEKSCATISTLTTQNEELSSIIRKVEGSIIQNSAELQEVKAKNIETNEKFKKFVDALYKPVERYNSFKLNAMTRGPFTSENVTQDNLYGLITDAVKTAEMCGLSSSIPVSYNEARSLARALPRHHPRS